MDLDQHVVRVKLQFNPAPSRNYREMAAGETVNRELGGAIRCRQVNLIPIGIGVPDRTGNDPLLGNGQFVPARVYQYMARIDPERNELPDFRLMQAQAIGSGSSAYEQSPRGPSPHYS